MACQCVVVVEEYCEWNNVCDSLITRLCVVCCLFVIRINANVNEIMWMPDLLRPPVWVCGGNLCLPQLATSGSPIVQQISRYGDTPKYSDMVDRDIGHIYRHMSKKNYTTRVTHGINTEFQFTVRWLVPVILPFTEATWYFAPEAQQLPSVAQQGVRATPGSTCQGRQTG